MATAIDGEIVTRVSGKSGDFNYDRKYRGATVKPALILQQDGGLSDRGYSGFSWFRHFGLNWAFVDPKTPIQTGVKFCVCVKELFPWLMMPLKVVYVNENRNPKKVVALFMQWNSCRNGEPTG
ncbi:hypothetical protein Fot_00667 [Forsythia ovata]|uniref:Transposase n=1 Tax=Forsythia ovata TaxID=205694 RepID=A0ABD1X1R9_9LAMI